MALYKRMDHLTQSASPVFDTKYAPGTKIENGGIYCCAACGEEVIVAKGHQLPPATHHSHPAGANKGESKVEWQVIVIAQQK